MRKIVSIALALVIALGIVGVVKASSASAATVPATTRYQQTDSNIAYVGTWSTLSTSGASAGSYRRSSQNGASATVRFNGTYLAWIATKGTTLGKAFVSLDGGPAVSVDLSRSSVAYQQTVWSTGTVASGQHTVKIWRDPSSATGEYISVDAFDVAGSLTVVSSTTVPATVPATTRCQQTDSNIAYVGTWSTLSTSGASAGSYRRSSQNEASATVRFNGTYLAWVATKGTTLGKAFVSLDGGPAVSVDLSRSSVAYQQTVWSTGTVASGQHTVKIWRDPSSATGEYISVDAFDVAGSVLYPSTTPTGTVTPSGTLSVKNYGAKGDGSSDDRAALQNAINAGAAAGKTVYFPAGTYFLSQTSVFLTIPSNVTLQGEGDASVLRFQDDGLDKRSTGLQIVGRSNVAIRNIKLMGTRTNKQASVQLIRADGTSGLTLDKVTFDGGEYALRTTGSGSSPRASNITVTNCRTLSNVLNPFYFAYATNVRVSGCTLEANRVDCMPNRYPHHFYVNDGVDGLYVSGCTLSGGQHVSIDAHTDGGTPATNLHFSNIVFTDVVAGIYGAGVGSYHFDGVTLRSSRYEYDYAMVTLLNVKDFGIKNFDFAGTPGKLGFLAELWNCGSVVFENGSMTNCEQFKSATPKGCSLHSGTAPTYSNVTVG